MTTISEHRELTVPYWDHQRIIDEYSNFGWSVSNSVLINQLGGPLDPNIKVDQSTLNESFYIKLNFYRCVNDENLRELKELQSENDKLKYEDEKLGNGVVGAVFLTLVSIASFVSSFYTNEDLMRAILIVNGVLAVGFIAFIMISIIRRKCNAIENNKKVKEEKEKIFARSRELI